MDDDGMYPIDDWEDFFDRDIENREKAWNEPVGYGALDMVEERILNPPVGFDREAHLREMEEQRERIRIENELDEYYRIPRADIPAAPIRDERFGRVGAMPETPPGLLDRPASRDAPYNPYHYRPVGGPGSPKSNYRSPPLFSASLGQIKPQFGKVGDELVAFYTPCPLHRRVVTNNDCEKCEYQNFQKWRKNPGEEKRCKHHDFDVFYHDYYFGGLESSEEDEENR